MELLDYLIKQLNVFFELLLDPLEVALLFTALWITNTNAISQVINFYRIQSILLALVTGLTAIIKVVKEEVGGFEIGVLILFIFILPIALAWTIKWLLMRATASVSPKLFVGLTDEEQHEAERVWLKGRESTNIRSRDLFIFVALVAGALLLAFQIGGELAGFDQSERVGLMVSLALHLVGLYNMVVKRDIFSQVIGLLIMDHGLYLAVVKIVAIPVPATFFVTSLYFYTLITVFILVYLLPQLRNQTKSIDLSEISKESFLSEIPKESLEG